MELERNDIQGLVVSSYKHLTCAAYILLRISNAGSTRTWLSQRLGEITTATGKHPDVSLNVAFTSSGLKALGLKPETLATFSFPFQEGMAIDHRSRILGDNNESAPSEWEWGGTKHAVDLLLLLFAKDESTLAAELKRQQGFFSAGGLAVIKTLTAGRQPDSHEHFGFNDGIGQPVMEGTGNKQRQLDRTHHATELPAGEFLLSQPNVYGVTADGPAVSAGDDPRQLLPVVPADSTGLRSIAGMHDLGRNGTYLVFRQLAQHVAQFWNFLDQSTRGTDGASNPDARALLGAKFVGRHMSGAPLVLSPNHDDPRLANENNFSYANDAQGYACPFGAHIRRSNPRDSLATDPQIALNSANRHRILRRGRSYGSRLENPLVDDGVDRGLHFICLNSDIERQFEFVQQTWINNPVFSGLYAEVDPLVGNLAKGDALFTVPGKPLRSRVHNLSRFVVVKGGSYFFLPGMRALSYLVSL
jgi:Dyp-type peroxidase family